MVKFQTSIISFLRLPEVLRRRGVGRTRHMDDVRAGLWTRAVPLSTRAKGWPEDECAQLQIARLQGQSLDHIRRLVEELHAARAAVNLDTPDRAQGLKKLHAGRDLYWAARRAPQTCPASPAPPSTRTARRSSRSA